MVKFKKFVYIFTGLVFIMNCIFLIDDFTPSGIGYFTNKIPMLLMLVLVADLGNIQEFIKSNFILILLTALVTEIAFIALFVFVDEYSLINFIIGILSTTAILTLSIYAKYKSSNV